MRAQSPLFIASAGVSQEPPTTFTLGSARNCGAVSGVTPPVGQNATSANGPENAFSSGMPPTAVAGNSLRKVKPSSARSEERRVGKEC